MTDHFKRLIIFIVLITVFRLVYVNFVPLVPQEAYYWKYAKHLALSYFDHPPMTAYIIAFFTWIGGDSVFFIRLGSIVFSIGLMLVLYSITRRLFGNERWALLSVIAMNCTVMFSIGSMIITPDVPFLFFWALIVYSLVRLRESDQWQWWYLAGAALGFGLLSKYTAILIVPGIFVYLLLSASQRKWLLSVHPYLGLVLALVIFSPVIIWNSQHEWASFLFQSSSRFSQMRRLRLDYFFQLIGSQLGMLTPYLFFLVLVGWAQSGWRSFKTKDDRHSLLFWIALPVYLIFTLSSFRSLVKMNWLAPAYITSIIASIAWIQSAQTRWSERFKKWFTPGLILGLVIVLFMHLMPIVPIFPSRKGDTWTGWQELSARVMQIKQEMGEDTFIFGHEYKIPSEITFYTPHHEPTHAGEIIGEKGLQYTYWTNFNELIGKNAIFITSDAQRYRNMDNVRKYFDSVVEEPPLQIIHRGRVFRVFYIYRCYNYKGPAA
ncbi:MAG: glycosyltransferase family 39 protein [candidate division KSB1 bacterium]|nr:glycosyltransferase family 39 protein [candidate division KSB1 bacterium]